MNRDIMPDRVALDMESVCADTHKAYIDELNRRYGTDYTYDDVDNWNWVDQDERDFGEFMQIVEEAWEENWRDIPQCDPDTDLAGAVEELAVEYEVHLVTARVDVEREMINWLDMHDVLEVIREFHSIPPSETKADMDYDYYIDDKPHLANKIDDDQTHLLVSRPWNMNVDEGGNIVRVDSVADAVEYILG